MSEANENLLPCPCGAQAELHEWEEIDAKRWAARAKCNCGWEGPIGYANNHVGCYDAVNDLHKKRALAAWNKRAPGKVQVIPTAVQTAQTAQSACPQCGGSMVTWKCLCDPIWRGHTAPQPVNKTLASLSIMQKAFRVTETDGNPDPDKQRFHMRFTFRSMEELHAADDQWRAFAAQTVATARLD
jgi:predicted RNA-binding Zn-ribbon protein involved in translation (DUF1610 family)